MNAKKLKELANMTETSKRVLEFISERQRNTVYTAFSGLRADLKKHDGKEVDRKDFNSTFEALEKIGVGKLDCTETGTCIGFHWSIPIREVGLIFKSDVVVKQVKPKTLLRRRRDEPVDVIRSLKPKIYKPSATIIVLRKGIGTDTFETNEEEALKIISQLH